MSGLGWQDAVAFGLAALSLGWLVRRAWRRRRRGAACEDCPGCAPSARPEGDAPGPTRSPDLTSIEGIVRPKR